MRCQNCGFEMMDGSQAVCPRCGYALASAHDAGTAGAASGWGAPPANQGATAGMPPSPYAAPPSTPLGAQPYPYQPGPYGAPPSQPLAPGQTYPQTYPGYPGYVPLPPKPAKKSKVPVVVGALVAVVLVVAAAGGMLLLKGRGGASSVSTSSPMKGMEPIMQSPLTSSDTTLPAVPPHCQPESDGFHVTDGYFCYIPTFSGELTDGAVSVDVRLLSGANATPLAVFVRSPNTGNFYEFSVDETQHWFAGKDLRGTWTTLRQGASTAIRLLDTNTVVVRFVGSHFTFYVNGTKLVELDDSSLSSGQIGLGCGSNAEAVFSNLTIAVPH